MVGLIVMIVVFVVVVIELILLSWGVGYSYLYFWDDEDLEEGYEEVKYMCMYGYVGYLRILDIVMDDLEGIGEY